jgi:antitoxin MazE
MNKVIGEGDLRSGGFCCGVCMWWDIHYVYTESRAVKMTKTLIKHGNSLALVIDKPILELLGIDADTQLELTTNGNALLISPVRSPEMDQKFKDSVAMIHKRFGKAMKKLAE